MTITSRPPQIEYMPPSPRDVCTGTATSAAKKPNSPRTQLLQATAANPSRARARTTGVNVKRPVRSEPERIIEEEDGWDLIDDVSG